MSVVQWPPCSNTPSATGAYHCLLLPATHKGATVSSQSGKTTSCQTLMRGDKGLSLKPINLFGHNILSLIQDSQSNVQNKTEKLLPKLHWYRNFCMHFSQLEPGRETTCSSTSPAEFAQPVIRIAQHTLSAVSKIDRPNWSEALKGAPLFIVVDHDISLEIHKVFLFSFNECCWITRQHIMVKNSFW